MKRSAKYSRGLVVAEDTATNSVTVTPEGGNIIAVVLHYGEIPNDGFVRATMRTVGGKEIAPLQPIQNFRSRNVAFDNDGLPVSFRGGNQVILQVIGTNDFTADFPVDMTLIYELSEAEIIEATGAMC